MNGEVQSYVFDDLPEPVSYNDYHCDRSFKTNELKELLNPTQKHGLIVISRGEGAVGMTTSSGVEMIGHYNSNVQGKTRAGGQSAQRFARVRETQKHNFFKKIAKIANDKFIQDGKLVPQSIIIGGTDITVNDFIEANVLDHRLKNNVSNTYSIHHTDEQGLKNLYQIAQNDIVDKEQQKASKTLDLFFNKLNTEIESVVYGYDEIEHIIEWGAIEIILMKNPSMLSNQQKDKITNCGGEIVVIPDKTPKYDEFVSGFNGIAALCRYPIK